MLVEKTDFVVIFVITIDRRYSNHSSPARRPTVKDETRTLVMNHTGLSDRWNSELDGQIECTGN